MNAHPTDYSYIHHYTITDTNSQSKNTINFRGTGYSEGKLKLQRC